MPLCKLCQSIDFSVFVTSVRRTSPLCFPIQTFPTDHNLFYYNSDECVGFTISDGFIPHHGDLEALKVNSAICDLCRLIETCVNDTFSQFQSANKLGYSYPTPGYKFFLCPRLQADGFQILSERIDELRHQYLHYDVMGGIGFCVDDESTLTGTIRGRKVPSSPICPAALKRIKKWVAESEVDQGHDYPVNARPARIIKIKSGGSEISVIPSNGFTGDYAALSHCWGSAQPASLNKDTATSLIAGVKTHTLPQSFQDAIWLVYELGIRYLWIDSLCILQDNPEDWAQESARMDKVYGHAVLTISASRAAGCDEGFLSDRLPRSYVSIPLTTNSHSGDILAFALPRQYAGDTHRCARLDDEPLSSRGWALQERYLSSRTLHFGHLQTFFESAAYFEAEDFCSVRTNLERLQRIPRDPARGSPPSLTWHRVVEEYTQRKLTVLEDKLPALAGLAKYFAATASGHPGNNKPGSLVPATGYLAGLRWDKIIEDLSWSLHFRSRKDDKRLCQYRAPSWSWASIDGAIDYCSVTGPENHLAVARDASIYLDSDDSPFGKVTGGWLYLQAMRIRLKRHDEGGPGERWYIQEDDISFHVTAIWDTVVYQPADLNTVIDPTGEKLELWLIPLWWDSRKGGNALERHLFGPFFLIVKAIDHQVSMYKGIPGFRRVGCGRAWVRNEDPIGLKRPAESWTIAKEKGELEGMLLL